MRQLLPATVIGLAALCATPSHALRAEPPALSTPSLAHGTVQGATLWYLLVDLALQSCQGRAPGQDCAHVGQKTLN
jgi:hypothetical protein